MIMSARCLRENVSPSDNEKLSSVRRTLRLRCAPKAVTAVFFAPSSSALLHTVCGGLLEAAARSLQARLHFQDSYSFCLSLTQWAPPNHPARPRAATPHNRLSCGIVSSLLL